MRAAAQLPEVTEQAMDAPQPPPVALPAADAGSQQDGSLRANDAYTDRLVAELETEAIQVLESQAEQETIFDYRQLEPAQINQVMGDFQRTYEMLRARNGFSHEGALTAAAHAHGVPQHIARVHFGEEAHTPPPASTHRGRNLAIQAVERGIPELRLTRARQAGLVDERELRLSRTQFPRLRAPGDPDDDPDDPDDDGGGGGGGADAVPGPDRWHRMVRHDGFLANRIGRGALDAAVAGGAALTEYARKMRAERSAASQRSARAARRGQHRGPMPPRVRTGTTHAPISRPFVPRIQSLNSFAFEELAPAGVPIRVKGNAPRRPLAKVNVPKNRWAINPSSGLPFLGTHTTRRLATSVF